MTPLRLGILVTHPVQYHAPLFRVLADEPDIQLTVFFAHRPTPDEQGVGFGVPFSWDVDILSGYRHVWLRNVAVDPGTAHYTGCDTPELGEIIRHERFDAFLVMGWHARTYWQAIRAAWAVGTPLLVRGDSQLDPAEPRLKRALKRIAYPTFIRRFACCLSVGRRSAEYFRYYGARSVIPSPHFVDNDFFATAISGANRHAVRASWGIPPNALVCLFAGKLTDKKRPRDLLSAVAQLRDRNVWAVFAGDGALRAECEALAAREAVSARFLGFMNQGEIGQAYAAADVLVLPSDAKETWGLVVNEAMAGGIPAIVSERVGCTPDLIVPGETGFSYPLGDLTTLSQQIALFAADRELSPTMGENARRHVSTFTAEAAARGVLSAAAFAARVGA